MDERGAFLRSRRYDLMGGLAKFRGISAPVLAVELLIYYPALGRYDPRQVAALAFRGR